MTNKRPMPKVDELSPKELKHRRQVIKNNVAALKERREEQGLKKYPVWVPDDPVFKARIKKYAEKLCKEYEKSQG